MQKVGLTTGLWLLAGRDLVGGERALELGLAEVVATQGETLDAALAPVLAAMRRQAPQVMRAFKALALGVAGGLGRAALERLETENFADTWIHDDHWAAVDKLLAGDTS